VGSAGGWGFHSAMMAKYFPKNIIYFEEDVNKRYCNKKRFKQTFSFLNPMANIDNYRFYTGSTTKIPLPDNYFKTVTLFISIHEFTYRDSMMQEIKRIMRNDGRLYILENAWKDTAAKDPECGFTYLSEKELYDLLARNGFGFTRHINKQTLEDTTINCNRRFLECYKSR
jgi:ubiquinone/menaquinone biosynthesis C-methylase UbiE